ncbi:hypothetical protein HAX54_014226 [Datura stramonium]|uniref:Uncharacterized protein n=1 Tax=Datura stramonium TaxID=4076 RepID=A0ABS8TPK1_DATST|nr:hypothetical protein [Datura stramonium]
MAIVSNNENTAEAEGELHCGEQNQTDHHKEHLDAVRTNQEVVNFTNIKMRQISRERTPRGPRNEEIRDEDEYCRSHDRMIKVWESNSKSVKSRFSPYPSSTRPSSSRRDRSSQPMERPRLIKAVIRTEVTRATKQRGVRPSNPIYAVEETRTFVWPGISTQQSAGLGQLHFKSPQELLPGAMELGSLKDLFRLKVEPDFQINVRPG